MRIAAIFLCALIILIWALAAVSVAYIGMTADPPGDEYGGLIFVFCLAALPVWASIRTLRLPPQKMTEGISLFLSALGVAVSAFLALALVVAWAFGHDGCGGGTAC